MMNAQTILSYGKPEAGRLFPGGKPEIQARFRMLAKSWHPDRTDNPKAAEVFAHIVTLRDAALRAGGQQGQAPRGATLFEKKDGTTFKAYTIASGLTDFGKVHIGRRSISFEYGDGLGDIAIAERERVEKFRFADEKMRQQMLPSLPVLVAHADLAGGGALNIFERPGPEILLEDFIGKFGSMPGPHAAWLGSGLLNIACYLEWAGIVHGAIGMDTVMVNPETHSVRLVGGWGLSVKEGMRPDFLPHRTLDLLPALAVSGQVMRFSHDLELIRRTVREALGDPGGTRLKGMGLPEPLLRFLNMPSGQRPQDDYAAWQKALIDAWGPRKFIKFDGTARDVYAG